MNSNTPLVVSTGGLRLGGSTTFLLNLGKAFHERGLTLPIVCLTEEHEMADDFSKAGVKVHLATDRKLIYEDRLQLVYAAVAAQQPNGVLACLGGDSFEILRTVPAGVARVGIIQSDDPGPYKLVRQFAPWLDAIVGVSETICGRLRQESFGREIRIEYIPYGIPFGPAQVRSLRDITQPLKIIYVGRMIEHQKRVSRLLELVKALTARGEKFEFTFVGSGPELLPAKENLKHLLNVRFLGDVPNAYVSGLLRSMDIFVLLSDFEGLPLSLLEAMGEGVVPIVSDLESGMRELVTAETGIRVPVGDISAAANAITGLARDSARQAGISAAASDYVRRSFSAAIMGERHLKLITALSKGDPIWPAKVNIPIPLSLENHWTSTAWARPIRRLLRRFV